MASYDFILRHILQIDSAQFLNLLVLRHTCTEDPITCLAPLGDVGLADDKNSKPLIEIEVCVMDLFIQYQSSL